MILYEKRFGAFNLLFRFYGSPWPRAVIFAVPSTVMAVSIRLLAASYLQHFFLHPYAYSIFGGILGFMILFRTNLSYARYWEARTNIAQMSSKWGDAAIQVVSFDEAAKEPQIPGGTQFRAEFVHSMSLMHALAMQRFRGDSSLSNLTYGSFMDTPDAPPVDPADLPEWLKVRGWKSYLVLRVRHHHYQKYWLNFPLPVLGGLNKTEEAILSDSADPVYLVLSWIHRQLVARRMAGGIKEDAPIVSRIYQVLSDGMLGYENALKIRSTPFPFPYAQSMALLMHVNALGVPLLMAQWVGSAWLAALMTFIVVFGYYLISEISREIEDPFKFDPNDLPVATLHYDFNVRLVIAFVKGLIPERGLFSHISAAAIKQQIAATRPVAQDFCGESSSSWNKPRHVAPA
eukprot:jgi/Mesen1/4188/ME000219S03324